MRITVIRKTVKVDGGARVTFSVGTDFCIWSGTNGFGRYLWRESELPDKDGVHVFNLVDVPQVAGMESRK